jgi:WD40 repeat protein
MMRAFAAFLLFVLLPGPALSQDAEKHAREVARFNHAEKAAALAFSPDGQLLATAGYDKAVHIWDLRTKKERVRFDVPYGAVWGIAFAPSGKHLAVGHYRDYRTYLGVVRILDIASGKETAAWVAHKENVYFVAYSPDGKRLLTAGHDRTIRAWDVAEQKELFSIPGQNPGWQDFAVSADGKTLAAPRYASNARPLQFAPPSEVHFWDWQTGKELRKLPLEDREYRSVTFAPDFKTFAIVDRESSIRLLNAADGKEIRKLETGRENRCPSKIRFSSDGKTLVSAEHVTELLVWDVETAKVRLALTGHVDSIHALAISNDSRYLASASEDLSVRVWDLTPAKDK